MKISVSFQGIMVESRQWLQQLCEERAHQLERHRLSSAAPELTRMEVHIAKNPAHHLYRVALRLRLPSGLLSTVCEKHDLRWCIKDAFDDLDRRTERHLTRLQHAHLWKRPARRQRLKELKRGLGLVQEGERRRALYELIEPHLPELYGYVRRELLLLNASADARAEALEEADIIGGVLLRALLAPRSQSLHISEWLLGLAQQELSAQLQEASNNEALIAAPGSRSEEPTAADEERYEYWQPDERVSLEDLLPDPQGDNPLEAAMARDAERALVRAAAALPRAWRLIFLLTTIQGLTAAQAADVLEIPAQAVEQTAQQAEAFIKQRLADECFLYSELTPQLASWSRLAAVSLPPEKLREVMDALIGEEPTAGSQSEGAPEPPPHKSHA